MLNSEATNKKVASDADSIYALKTSSNHDIDSAQLQIYEKSRIARMLPLGAETMAGSGP